MSPTAQEYKDMGYTNWATKAWGDLPDVPETERTLSDYEAGYAVADQSPAEIQQQISKTLVAGTEAESVVVQAITQESQRLAAARTILEGQQPQVTPTGGTLMTNGYNGTLPGQETLFNGQGTLPAAPPSGYETTDTGYNLPAGGVTAAPMGFGIVAWIAAGWLFKVGAKLFMRLGTAKAFIARWGFPALKALVGIAAATTIADAIMGGLDDGTAIEIIRRTKRRYSIGSNPRVRTLQKVSRHCKRMLKKHEKVIREFLPKPRTTYGQVPASMLSAAEKKLLKG